MGVCDAGCHEGRLVQQTAAKNVLNAELRRLQTRAAFPISTTSSLRALLLKQIQWLSCGNVCMCVCAGSRQGRLAVVAPAADVAQWMRNESRAAVGSCSHRFRPVSSCWSLPFDWQLRTCLPHDCCCCEGEGVLSWQKHTRPVHTALQKITTHWWCFEWKKIYMIFFFYWKQNKNKFTRIRRFESVPPSLPLKKKCTECIEEKKQKNIYPLNRL